MFIGLVIKAMKKILCNILFYIYSYLIPNSLDTYLCYS